MALTKVQPDLITSAATSMVVGCDCKNNSGTPNTQYDLDADIVVLRASDGSSVVRFNPGAAITNNVSTAGPAANGRDQAGSFSANTWIHFYWIWNGTTLATVSSNTAPPTGPTLPSGYTHWAYAGVVRFNNSSALILTRIKGSTVFYQRPIADAEVLSNGTQTNETAVTISGHIPPNALSYKLHAIVTGQDATGTSGVVRLRVVTTVDRLFLEGPAFNANVVIHSGEWELENVGQTLFYIWTTSPGTAKSANLYVNSYKVPNGGE